jgi:carboxymethylenebutenolidase
MTEKTVEIKTTDGTMPTTIVHPDSGGPFPVILYLMDAPGIRPAFLDMVRRLAGAGYYVMAPDLYYRSAPVPPIKFGDPDDMKRMFDLIHTVTVPRVVADAKAMLDFAKTDRAADPKRVGTAGFCMGGKLALGVAKAFPDVVKAAASLHGGRLVTDQDDSPHKNLAGIKAEIYFGWADEDQSAPKETIPDMEQALKAAGIAYKIDYRTGAKHGYTMSDLPPYNKEAAEAHWRALFDLFKRKLV